MSRIYFVNDVLHIEFTHKKQTNSVNETIENLQTLK